MDKPVRQRLLDDVDHGLIDALREDGRMGLGEMGRRVGLSGDAVRERLRRLREAGMVRVQAQVDPAALGYGTLAMVLVTVRGNVGKFAERLVAVEEIDTVVMVAGSADLLLEFVCRDDEHLNELLDRHIRGSEEVYERSVLVYLEVLKDTTGDDAAGPAARPVGPKQLDDIDRAVLAALQRDGRASYQDIADHTGLSYSHARRRTVALIESQTVRIGTSVNRVSQGRVVAAVGVRTQGPIGPIQEALQSLDEVQFAVVTAGPFDLVIDVACRDRARLVQLVLDELRTTPGISATEIFLYLELRKLPLWWSGLVRQPDGVGELVQL
ncbi:Lrp/AsnC family transcriptional regulator [Streptomyces fuscichromogenes]|uniref:Lrp/AsnC family transcriptional regulator n=1 Tax=Streptomyces fuscichromogenes TaxID=1324013 RepID=UPI003814EA1E